MIPFSLFEQVSRFDLSDIIELKNHSNYLRIFGEILGPGPNGILYLGKEAIEIEDTSLVPLIRDADKAINDLTGISSIEDLYGNRAPGFKISIDPPKINDITYERLSNNFIEIRIDSKSTIPKAGKLIDSIIKNQIEKGIGLRLPSSYNELLKDEQIQLVDSVNTILVQNAIAQIEEPNFKKLSHDDLVKEYISGNPIFMNLIRKNPEMYIGAPWLTPEQKKDLELLVKANRMIF